MKRILFICLAALFLLPGIAMAHSKITVSTPAKEETVTVSPAEITMTFNTNIEKLSQFKLLDESGNQVQTGDITVSKATMSGSVTEPLKNGAYTVKWTIIGADGHAVDGEYAFTVDAAEATPSPTPEAAASPAESSPSPSAEVTEAPDASASADDNLSEVPAPAAPAEDIAESGKNNGVNTAIWVIAGIIVAAAVVIVIRRSRK
ncbi:copper resistance CopC family protein [Paenibacillus sp. JDR-2]|uniref:copper resistance CopC family protein n=1 Tax=Paenibacillus sp. (strain JDR-2) TaxID=324057 RepID=UPI0001667A28|nr:copper resistance CopC family protein [Paenibacillus sp. JDR-2]ACT02982.1 copper resistance protein CopC [Paenibacillus sp. JDR-2]